MIFHPTSWLSSHQGRWWSRVETPSLRKQVHTAQTSLIQDIEVLEVANSHLILMITNLVLTASKGSSTFEFYFGEYFQSIRILFKHCGLDRKNTNKEDCRVKSESEQIDQDCRAESESEQNFGPLSTTPPSPLGSTCRAFASSPAPWSRSLQSGVPPPW